MLCFDINRSTGGLMDNADARSCRANVTGFFEIPLPPTNNFFMVVN